ATDAARKAPRSIVDEGRFMIATKAIISRGRSSTLRPNVVFYPVDDVRERRSGTGGKDALHACSAQPLDVIVGNDAPAEHDDVVGAAGAQSVNDGREERIVSA